MRGYKAGDLERKYAALGLEETFFVNYGFVTPLVYALMHPRPAAWSAAQRRRVDAILSFVIERGEAHPRDVEERFAHGTVTNYWGGSSNATTHLLNAMHYRGVLRVVRRDNGIRVYGAPATSEPPVDKAARTRRVDALIDVIAGKYAPLPAASLWNLIYRLRYAVPQWQRDLKPALQRAKARLAHARVDGVEWYWPHQETIPATASADIVRLLAPFDPVVWDRRRFEIFWGWAYRFEAYTPVKKRVRGYYALPLLWRDRVVGWGNVSVKSGALDAELGYVAGRAPRDRGFRAALEEELDRLRAFLGCGTVDPSP